MATPILHLLAGPKGAGKTTFVTYYLQPATHLPIINADAIAAEHWRGSELEHAYEASQAAAQQRQRLTAERCSFITETVFSHPSKVDLIAQATSVGHLVHLHVILVARDTPVERVKKRVASGGHDVPETKVRERYDRLWPLVAAAQGIADQTTYYDNSLKANPFRVVAAFERGRPTREPDWPAWAPTALTG